MKKISIAHTALFCCMLLFSTLTYADKPECKGELANVMHDSKEALKSVREAIDSDDEEVLQTAVVAFITSLKKSKEYQPTGFAKLPEAKRDKKFAAYQNKLDDTIAIAEKLKNPDTRSKALKALKKSRKSGHKKYKRCEAKDH